MIPLACWLVGLWLPELNWSGHSQALKIAVLSLCIIGITGPATRVHLPLLLRIKNHSDALFSSSCYLIFFQAEIKRIFMHLNVGIIFSPKLRSLKYIRFQPRMPVSHLRNEFSVHSSLMCALHKDYGMHLRRHVGKLGVYVFLIFKNVLNTSNKKCNNMERTYIKDKANCLLFFLPLPQRHPFTAATLR